jgi:4-hydroxy-3-methylbut-2-en-1-yl diphosphate reductase
MSSFRKSHFSSDDSLEVAVAPNGGACFGVVRAVKLGMAAAERRDSVYSVGALVHNPKTIRELEAKGMQVIEDPSQITSGTAVLRSHGIKQQIEKELRDKGVKIVDATCPLVKKPQRIASSLGEKGYFLVLVGDSKHPEVKGVLSYFDRPDYLVTYNPEEVAKIPAEVKKVGVVAQTTIEAAVFNAVLEKCKERFSEVAVYNTICDATSIRQSEAQVLAQEAEVFVVVGGRSSSNTNKLVKICKSYQPNTYLVEEKEEIQPEWFTGKKKIAVTGGAATPQDYVDEVGEYIFTFLTRLTSDKSANQVSI